ncbi:MotA/TolQ/ExbB proton channel family protein [Ottowia testudinis]|uniref:MotA/TolQ/ExbB proton channel family protein n=1 Tax=Ottowia testudinis TaxID=2816950 RepID=A0A975CH70_9BURK|nr:MotA/TolQ/ExbB proton channel family protein [Ottowia testudinis]QTD46373.1 MotA/TolQ/ExbB proton channel family protein [Ottowia testudinis]
MSTPLEGAMFSISQWFLTPVLVLVALLFGYAFYALGAFGWQAVQRAGARRRGDDMGHELLQAYAQDTGLTQHELEALAVKRLEAGRIAARVAPMLGLVATMIPMGPALQSLADGQLAEMSRGLMVAFSAVILALIAAAITYAVVHVRRRWYAQELIAIERLRQGGPPAASAAAALHAAGGALA